MGKKRKSTEELLQDLIILELAKAGVPQSEIQKVVGVDMHRVNRIARYFKGKK
jgi:hypothetical protein